MTDSQISKKQTSWSEFRRKWLTGRKHTPELKGLPPAWLLALDSHIAWGVAIPSFTAWILNNFYYGAVAILFVSLLKEVFADPYFEGLPFKWNGLEDWLEYWAGVIGVGIIGVIILHVYP